MRKFTTYWLPALLWMGGIFSASSDRSSAEHSSRFIAPFVRWLFPSLAEPEVERAVFLVRKLAHLTEYAVLAGLLWWARRQPWRGDRRPWISAHARFAWFASVIFAVTDEIHQNFVPTRIGTPWDVLIDGCGAALGLAIVRAIGRWRRLW